MNRQQRRAQARSGSGSGRTALTPAAQQAFGRAVELHRLARLEEAEALYRVVLADHPDHSDSLQLLGLILSADDRINDGIAMIREAIRIRPDAAEYYSNLGNVYARQKRFDEAIRLFKKAIRLRPDYIDALCNLGAALNDCDQFEAAVEILAPLADARRDLAVPQLNIAASFYQLGRLEEAEAHLRQALAIAPDYGDARYALSYILFRRGDYAAGFSEYEWRFRMAEGRVPEAPFTQPRWNGEAAPGKTLLIHAEQGFGDTIQFCRYATAAQARGLRVVLRVQPPLVGLLRSLDGVDSVIGEHDQLPEFDFHIPMLSLPLACGPEQELIPSPDGYLQPSAERVEHFRLMLSAGDPDAKRVGLVWSGNSAMKDDRRRSIPPSAFSGLFKIPRLSFYNLHKAPVQGSVGLKLHDLMPAVVDFEDSAALIMNLDLVITVDTAVAHLAGALGKPVWLVNRFASCWRWVDGHPGSPWYSSMRVYRQKRFGNWSEVVSEVEADLRALAS